MKPILSAKIGVNADLFPDILTLYAKHGAKILDATFGRGMFWKKVERTDLHLVKMDSAYKASSDVLTGDFTSMPFAAETFDVVILDPPYAVTKSPTHSRGKCAGDFAYGLAGGKESNTRSTNEENVELYRLGAKEAHRVLMPGGFLVLKTQDDATFWKHIYLMHLDGYVCEDLFIMVSSKSPVWDIKWKVQHHARKNHSYFIVLKKMRDKEGKL